jgi:diguanylate cyclase (GGDEF)-like protein
MAILRGSITCPSPNGKLVSYARGWQEDEHSLINKTDGHTFVAAGASEFSFVPMLPDSHRVTRLVLPIVHEQRTAGFIAIGLHDHQRVSDGELRRLRDLADRAAVALSNAAWEERLYRQAHYDSVTNLPNRNLLQDRIEQALSNARRKALQAGVLFLDLDHFKHVNDSLGHSVGDELLVQVARRIQACIRGSDTVARLGGDEFIVVCPDLPSGGEGVAVITRIGEKIINALNEPLRLEGRELHCSSSIGIAVYPEDGLEPEELLKRADAAMYEAKRRERHGMAFYSRDLEAVSAARLEVESGLKRALSNDEFVLYYQPKLDARGW